MKILKLLIIFCLRFILKIFYIFPIKKNYILFNSFEGRQFSDNPKYLFFNIKEKYGEKYKYIWVLNDKNIKIDGARIVKFLSFSHIFYLMTCKYIISNLGIEPFVPKRHSQIFLNTWHGSGAYKSQTLTEKMHKSIYTVNIRDYRSKNTDYYVSGCKMYSDVMAVSWNADIKKFIPTGTPRNDILLCSEEKLSEIKKYVLKKLNLSNNDSYILFAPTFRGSSFREHDATKTDIDFKKLIEVCNKKFSKNFKILYREHIGATNLINDDFVVDVSAYPDMQEIMIASDILITDYSSSMWDFALLKRPGFLYVPDLNDYLKERDFYTPIDTWPFPYATNNEELQSLILNYSDEKNIKKIKQHQERLGSFENGDASKKIIEILGL